MNSAPPRDTSDVPEPIAWAVYGGKTGILRYVEQDAEKVRSLVEDGGYVARPLYEATAPADDVREALANVRRYMDAALSVGHTASQYRLADGGLSTLFHGDLDVIVRAAEVRPHGTVTAEAREAELRELHHFEVEQKLAETIAIVRRAQSAVLRHEHTPASLHMDSILNQVNTEIPSGSVRPYGTVTDTEWEYRGVVCEPDTGDVYDSTRPFDTEAEARQAAIDWGLLESNADLPQLTLRAERRRKAGSWGPVKAAREARS